MLELNVAPSPNPAAAATNSAPAAESPSADGVAPGKADGQPNSPFATVLQGHLKQAADSKTAKPAVEKDAAAVPAAEVPVDAIALLAPMLAGIVPAQLPAAAQSAADQNLATAIAAAADQSGDPTAIAAPAVVITAAALAPTTPVAAASAQAAADPAQRYGLAVGESVAADAQAAQAQPKASAAALQSANLAADAATLSESAADTGKIGMPAENFQSLLDAASDAQLMAGRSGPAHQGSASAAASAATTTVATPVGARGWNSEVGEKLTWMVSRQETHAELVLNPPQLGRIEVSLSMNGDQANAVFVSANATVREALENALPRLREILQDAGISLGQAQVGAESFQQSADNRENGDNPLRRFGRDGDGNASMPGELLAAGSSQGQWLRRGNGLVDTFA